MDILDAAKDSHSDCEWTPVYCCGISAIGGRPYQPLWEPHTRDAAGDRREEGWWGRVQCFSPDTPFFLCSCPVTLCRGPGRGRTKGSRGPGGSDSMWRCLECVLPQNPLLFWGEGGWGLGMGGWGVSVTDGLRVVGAFVDGGVCLNRDVLPPALWVSGAWGWVCGGCNGGFD